MPVWIKSEKKTLTQENKVLQWEVEGLQRRISRQDQLEEKIQTKQEKYRAISQHHTDLQQQVQELTKQLREAESLKEQYPNMEADTKATLKSVSAMQRTLSDLKDKNEKVQPFVTK